MFSLFCFVQFQLVADLFHDGKDPAPSAASKTSRINVRAAKPALKGHNREHRKSVGTQVRLGVKGQFLMVDPLKLCLL